MSIKDSQRSSENAKVTPSYQSKGFQFTLTQY